MSKRTGALPWVLALLSAFAFPPATPALAEEEAPPPSVVQHWAVWPKAGHAAEFEAAMKEFVAWRKAKGEGFSWNASQTVVGEDLVPYVFRAGPFHWKDLDAHEKWGAEVGVVAQYQKTVAPHVDRVEHYLVVLDYENSLWTESDEYRYWGVTLLTLAPGAYDSMIEALKTIRKIAGEKEWKPGWNIQWIIGGAGADLAIVNGYRSYAEMAPPETPFPQLLSEVLGSEQGARDLMREFGASFESGEYLIAASRPDLSTLE